MLQARKELARKQEIVSIMQQTDKTVKVDLNKLIVMPISELLKKKHAVLLHAKFNEAAKKL